MRLLHPCARPQSPNIVLASGVAISEETAPALGAGPRSGNTVIRKQLRAYRTFLNLVLLDLVEGRFLLGTLATEGLVVVIAIFAAIVHLGGGPSTHTQTKTL